MTKRIYGSVGGRIKSSTGSAAPGKPKQSVEEALAELKAGKKKGPQYREHSLKLHGTVCARCGREFDAANLHLLTVHHKDSNPNNNPPDGSNWENLCVYCHDEEHSREGLADYEDGRGTSADNTRLAHLDEGSGGFGTFADLLKKAGK